MMPKLIELFCGTKSVSNVFKENGWDVFTIDINNKFNPSLCIDMLNFDLSYLPEEWKHPDVIWASPPCTVFSIASLYRYWDKGNPKSFKTYIGLALALKTIEIIREIKPKYFFIENPRAMMRNQWFMRDILRKTVSYCQYGANVQKPTDIWNNCSSWIPKKMCHPGDSCHESARRGENKGTQKSSRSSEDRGIIPKALAEEIYLACCGKQKIIQEVLICQ
jgi:hypothetical protein